MIFYLHANWRHQKHWPNSNFSSKQNSCILKYKHQVIERWIWWDLIQNWLGWHNTMTSPYQDNDSQIWSQSSHPSQLSHKYRVCVVIIWALRPAGYPACHHGYGWRAGLCILSLMPQSDRGANMTVSIITGQCLHFEVTSIPNVLSMPFWMDGCHVLRGSIWPALVKSLEVILMDFYW